MWHCMGYNQEKHTLWRLHLVFIHALEYFLNCCCFKVRFDSLILRYWKYTSSWWIINILITFVAIDINISNQQTNSIGQTESNKLTTCLSKRIILDTPGWMITMIAVPWVLFTLNTTCIVVYMVFKGIHVKFVNLLNTYVIIFSSVAKSSKLWVNSRTVTVL